MSKAAPPRSWCPACHIRIWRRWRHSRRWRDDHRGKWFRVSNLAGFCLLLKRSVYDRIGGLDERSGATVFDADDLTARARQAGFTMAVAQGPVRPPLRRPALARLPHRPTRTSSTRPSGNSPGACAAGPIGAAITAHRSSRSGSPAEAHHVVARSPDLAMSLTEGLQSRAQRETCGLADGGVARPAPNRVRQVRVTLTMIVRDEENFPACLNSVRGLFDEIVVVDTGSATAPARLRRSAEPRSSSSPGSMISPRPATRRWPRHGRLRVLARCRRCDRAGPAGEVAGVVGRVAARREVSKVGGVQR